MSPQDRYFGDARSWATDTLAQEQRQRRTAWLIAGTAVAVALLEAVALALLLPLKTVQPITVLVDRQTGFVTALDPQLPRRIGADAALTQSLLAQYVSAREGFDRATVSRDYRRVALWSAGPARSQYLNLMPAGNPQSPFARFGTDTLVTRVKSVSPLSTGVALVRFDSARQNRRGDSSAWQPWIAVVRYRYVDTQMTFEDRLINPLGFQVVSYRRDAEAPPSPPIERIAGPLASSQPGNAAAREPQRLAYRSSNSAGPIAVEIRSVPSRQVPLGSPLTRYADARPSPGVAGQ